MAGSCHLPPLLSVLLLLPLLLAAAGQEVPAGDDSPAVGQDASPTAASGPTVCFVIRTYWGHGDTYGDGSLSKILKSLRLQTVNSWEALVLVYDARPFLELRRTINTFADDRISVFAEVVGHSIKPKDDKGGWVPDYHNVLYNMTDEAIRACSRGTRWVVVTNGDNMYDVTFVQELSEAPEDAEVIAFDFYSRYQRPTMNPCDRLRAGPGLPNCKENLMRFCQTDLAASAYRLSRLIKEDRRFGTVDPGGVSGANDGMLATFLLRDGWKVYHVGGGKCLVNHAPSPQQCALAGGVWDDSLLYAPESFGGACISRERANQKLASNPGFFELVEIAEVSHDNEGFGYGPVLKERGTEGRLPLGCLRHADKRWWMQAQVYGRVCAAPRDLADFPPGLPPHAWDGWLPDDIKSAYLR